MSIPAGSNVAVVVNGMKGVKAYRLSLIIPLVSQLETTYIANPTTSIAAEAIAEVNFKKSVIPSDTWETVLAKAQTYTNNNPDADYSLSGPVIQGTQFGASDSLNSSDPGLTPITDTKERPSPATPMCNTCMVNEQVF